MASIFLSFSSRDERAARGLQTWLAEHHQEVVLLDRSKKQEQGRFDDLRPEFESAINRADIVLFLVTPFWQASRLCEWEFETAKTAEKTLLGVLEAPTNHPVSGALDLIDMTRNREDGLVELREALQRAAPPEEGATRDEGEAKNSDIVLQGAVIVDHDPNKKSVITHTRKTSISPDHRQAGVNRTLKILQRGIRWSTFPAWFTRLLKLPVAGTRVKTRKTLKTLGQKLSGFNPLLKRGSKWVIADKMRVAGVAFLAFVVATAVIGFVSDRTIGGKDAVRKELANVKKRQSLFLSRVANHLRETGEVQTALLLSLEAFGEAQEKDDRLKARDALYTSWVKIQDGLVIRGHENHVSGAVFSPDGRYILTSSWDRTARVWKKSTRKQVLRLDGHDGFVNSAVFNPDQSLILTAGLDNRARLFNARTGKPVRVLKGHNHELTSAEFSTDGRRIVTASSDQTARMWDVAGGKTLKIFLGFKAGLEHASFSPDGERIVTAGADHVARIIDVGSGDMLATLKGHGDVVRDARYDPAGKLIATASQDKTVRLWSARSGVLQRVLRGHQWAVLSASFSPDGKRLVSASKDNTARIWDVATGDLLLVLRGHKGIVSGASFSPDGKMVVTASGDGTARLWPLPASDQDLVARARRTVTRCLTSAQRKKYFLGETLPDWCRKLKHRTSRK